MARLISVHGEDFAGFREFKMRLARQGLTFIAGDNRDTDSASSNGACKTGLFKAIGWGLYGKAVDGVVGDEVIHIGQTCARVTIKIEDGDDTYVIVRERRKQSPKLFIEQNGEQVKRSKADLQLIIDNLIGADWEGFRNTAMYGQRDRDRFVYPTTKDGERKTILHRILRTGVFELAHVEAKKRRLTIEKDLAAAKSEVERLTERISDVDLDALQERADGFAKENRTKVAALAEEARTLAAKAKDAIPVIDAAALRAEQAKSAQEAAKLTDEVEAAKKKRHASRDAYRNASTDIARLEAELKANASTLKLLEGDQCPTCTADLAKGRGADHKRSLEARKVDLESDMVEARKARQRASQAETEADQAIERAEERAEELTARAREIREELDSVEAGKKRARELVDDARAKADEAKTLKDAPNRYLEDLTEAQGKVSKLKQSRKGAKVKVAELTDDLAHLEFWARGFGPTGIPSFALDSVMPFITERANHYLKTLSDGDITINFSTQRELKSAAGELRDEIGITWFIEGIENYPPSGGQWKKMEIATNFALMDLVATREGSHVNILCLDECLDGLDGEGKQRVVNLLHKLRSERESIFVISHDAELSEVFERTLIVIKEDGVSRLEKAT